MDAFTTIPWHQYPAAAVIIAGVVIFWRGMLDGGRGLVRRRIEMLERLEGWRLTLVGLTIVGLGLAWFIDARWLFFLSLGVGFVEIQEANRIIKAWRWNGGARDRTPASAA